MEWLYLSAIQTRHVTGTDPDDGGHSTLRIGWNDPTGRNRPLFCVIIGHTQSRVKTRMLISPLQMRNFADHVHLAVRDQQEKFSYGEPPDWDTRYMRVRDEG